MHDMSAPPPPPPPLVASFQLNVAGTLVWLVGVGENWAEFAFVSDFTLFLREMFACVGVHIEID